MKVELSAEEIKKLIIKELHLDGDFEVKLKRKDSRSENLSAVVLISKPED